MTTLPDAQARQLHNAPTHKCWPGIPKYLRFVEEVMAKHVSASNPTEIVLAVAIQEQPEEVRS
jgi:hypothetical protein